jgi:hypothetical protein
LEVIGGLFLYSRFGFITQLIYVVYRVRLLAFDNDNLCRRIRYRKPIE